MLPATPDPFAALGLEPRFDLERPQIERAYLARAAQAHPDLSGEPHDAATLNEARLALLNPESRANALLALHRGPSPAADNTLPDGFLMTIMQTRLDIEQAIESSDAQGIRDAHTWAADQRRSYTEQVAAAFQALTEPPAPPDLAAIRQTLNAWRYIERLIEQLPDASPRA